MLESAWSPADEEKKSSAYRALMDPVDGVPCAFHYTMCVPCVYYNDCRRVNCAYLHPAEGWFSHPDKRPGVYWKFTYLGRLYKFEIGRSQDSALLVDYIETDRNQAVVTLYGDAFVRATANPSA